MSIRHILIHCDNSSHCESRLSAGMKIAKCLDASFSGFYAVPPVTAMAFAGNGPSPLVYERELEEIAKDTNAAKAMYETIAAANGDDAPLLVRETPLFEGIGEAARCTDLVLVSQHDPDDPRCRASGLAAHVALTSGVPVLVLPTGLNAEPLGDDFAQRIVVAWNGSREGVRALHDALPLITRAEAVHILSINDDGSEPAAVCAHLARHGVHATSHRRGNDGRDIGEALLEESSGLGANLIVLGAYGHSRLREFVLGGVTRELLLDSPVPLLLSH